MMLELEPDGETINNVLRDLGKTKEEFEEEVNEFRQWLLEQPHLPHLAGKNLLSNFVLAAKSLVKAKEKLQYYYENKKKNVLFLERDPELLNWESIIDYAVLPGTTAEGIVVSMIMVPDKTRVHKWDFLESTKLVLMSVEALLVGSKIIGHYFIMDLRNLSLRFLWRCSVFTAKSGFNGYLKVLPVRAKGFIFLNCPPLTGMFLKIFVLPFLSEKLKKRIYTYAGNEGILNHIPSRMLPKDYGGDCATFEELCKLEKERIWTYRDFFLDTNKEENSQSRTSSLEPNSVLENNE